MEFFEAARLLATVATAPYGFTWNQTAPGNYTLFAKATDNLGAMTTAAPITITVMANQAPNVSMTATPANATAPAEIVLAATASDADGGIAKVEFFNGATLLASVAGAPYSYRWRDVGAGSHSVTAQATDEGGAVTTSAPVMVTVSVPVMVTVSVPEVQGERVYYIDSDHLGTPRVITDAANRVVWQWENNDPFGANMPNENPSGLGVFRNNLRLPGQYFDAETGLHYNYFRTYDPQTGRYVQSDPIGLEGGMNTYLYGDANPVGKTDPLGLATYQCIRGLGQKPGGYVSPGNATHHQYSCVTLPNGASICGGQGPGGNPISSPGKPTTPDEDYLDKNSCQKTQDDNQCFELCLQNEWSKPRPRYSVFPGLGTQCQQYDDDVNTTCRKKCALK